MKEARRKLLLRWILYSLLGFVALFLVVQNANAAVTGKIAGLVVDANTGEPLPGANIVIEGTQRGAACDVDGYYFISRLNPGTYNVQARMMGYETVTKTGVRVESGHTTPVDFQLKATVVPGKGVTVQAMREIIKIDLSSSSITADRNDIEAVPLISDVRQYLNLQAGIDGWSVRGSGLEDTRLMADGLLLVDQRANEPIMMPNLSEIKEISLIKGGFNAEYSNVRAGVVNVITKEGSPGKYEGSFEFRYTPGYQKHNGTSIFDPDNFYNEVYFHNKLDTGVQWNLDYWTEETLGLDTVIKLDSVCWKGPYYVWGDPTSPFYDTMKWKSCARPDWKGWISESMNKPIKPEAFRDMFLWIRRIDTREDTLYRHFLGTPDSLIYLERHLPRTDSLFSIYSHDSMYVPIWDTTGGDYELTGFYKEPYTIPENEPRIGTYGDKPDLTLDAGFGGPVPVLGQYLGDMTFYVSYRDFKEAFPLPDSRDYYQERQTSLKLTSRLGKDIKVNLRSAYSIVNSLSPWESGTSVGHTIPGYIGQVYLRGAFDMIQSKGEWNGINHGSDKIQRNPVTLYNVNALTPFNVYSRIYGISLQHALSENTFYDVKLNYLRSNNEASFWYDVPNSMRDTVLIWFGEAFDSEGEYITDRNHIADYAVNDIPYGSPHPDFTTTTGRIQFPNIDGSVYGPMQTLGTFDRSWSQSYGARFDFTSQFNKYNEVKLGVEVNYDKIHEDHIMTFAWVWTEPGEEYESQAYFVTYDAYPILGGAYIQDKIEFEGMFANIGLRFDYADPNTEWPSRDKEYLYSPFYSSNLKSQLFEQDSIIEDVPAILKLSPRVGVSFPVMEKSKLFFNYGHFYSLSPSRYRFMVGWGTPGEKLRFIGNPWLDMSRTISYELGFESNIADMFLARVTGYYKDSDNQYTQVTYSNYDRTVDYRTYENLEYGDTRGFEFELRKSTGRFFTGWVIYDYRVLSSGKTGRENHYSYVVEQARGGLSDPEQTEAVFQPVWRAQVTFKTPVDWGIFFGGYNLSLLYSWRAGRYETWNPFNDPEFFYILQNNIQWEDGRNMDFSLSKNISFAGTALTLFMDIHNLLDWQELSSQGFYDGGDRTKYLKSLHLEIYNYEPFLSDPTFHGPAPGEKPDDVGDLSSDGKPWINDPNRDFLKYLDPRYVQFGIRFSF